MSEGLTRIVAPQSWKETRSRRKSSPTVAIFSLTFSRHRLWLFHYVELVGVEGLVLSQCKETRDELSVRDNSNKKAESVLNP